MSRPGFVVWFTGLSGAGKSTLATLLAAELQARGAHVEVLDGDEVRTHLTKGLGFSREDRDTNVRRIGYVARLLARAGAVAITAAISPYRATRDEQRAAAGRFLEVYCRCPIDALAARDPKGLYKKALAGEITGFTGIDDPYEEPERPDVVVDTAERSVGECLAQILSVIEARGFLRAGPAPGAFVRARDRVHLGALGPARPVGEVRLDADAWAIAEGVEHGVLSPLAGPLGARDATKLRKEGRLESGLAWPLPWQLPLPAGVVCGPGDTLELVGPEEQRTSLRVTEVWTGDRGEPLVAGVVLPAGAGLEGLHARRGALLDAAGFLVRGPLDDGHERLFDVALEARGRLVLAVPRDDEALLAAALRVVTTRGLEDSVLVETLPRLPRVPADRDALLQVVVLRNLGVGAAILDAPGPDGPAPRAALSSLRPAELGLEVVAAGPVERGATHGLFTRRMRAR